MGKVRRVALVTGGAIRVGEKIARFLHLKGYRVLITYNKSEEAAVSLRAEGVVSEIFQWDMSSSVFPSFPRIDLLINNASIFEREELLDPVLLDQNLDIHIKAPMILADILFRQKGKSHIINILDNMSFDVGRNFISYHITKKLLEEATRLQSVLYHPKVRINGIAPKILMKNNRQSEAHFNALLSQCALNPLDLLLEDILFLENSSITGQIIV